MPYLISFSIYFESVVQRLSRKWACSHDCLDIGLPSRYEQVGQLPGLRMTAVIARVSKTRSNQLSCVISTVYGALGYLCGDCRNNWKTHHKRYAFQKSRDISPLNIYDTTIYWKRKALFSKSVYPTFSLLSNVRKVSPNRSKYRGGFLCCCYWQIK